MPYINSEKNVIEEFNKTIYSYEEFLNSLDINDEYNKEMVAFSINAINEIIIVYKKYIDSHNIDIKTLPEDIQKVLNQK